MNNPKTVKICRKGPKLLGNFFDIDIHYRGKHWAYRGTIPCSYNVKKCPDFNFNIKNCVFLNVERLQHTLEPLATYYTN